MALSFCEEQKQHVSLDVRKNSARTKIKVLVHGVQDAPDIFEHFHPYKEEHYAYDNGNWGVAQGRLVPSEILLPGGIVSKLHIRLQSPLRLRLDGSKLVLLEDQKEILSEVSFLPRPKFWNFSTTSGIPTKKLAHIYGVTCINFNRYSGCQFYDVGKPCKFCSVKPTQELHQGVVINKNPQDLAETCHLATQYDRVEWFLATGGSYLDGDREFDAHLAVIRAVRNELPWGGRLRGNLSLMPPRTLERLKELYELGVDHPSFNLEVWPRQAFEAICPGKTQYVGFDHIMLAYEKLVDLYGPGRVWCNFVAGLVPLKDQMDGFTAMAKRGVIPGANVYHPDVGSPFGYTIPSPNEEYIRTLYLYAAELYHEYGYIPFFDSAVLRNSLANEAYEGLLN
jgi:hypothetical protein